jgi:hypothetical protein
MIVIYTRIANWRRYKDLTLGKMYKVISTDPFSKQYVIKDDVGDACHFNPEYFTSLEIIRDQKIDSLCEKY